MSLSLGPFELGNFFVTKKDVKLSYEEKIYFKDKIHRILLGGAVFCFSKIKTNRWVK